MFKFSWRAVDSSENDHTCIVAPTNKEAKHGQCCLKSIEKMVELPDRTRSLQNCRCN